MRMKDEVQREVDRTRRRLESLLNELAEAPDVTEPPVGSVITFMVQFDPFGPSYKYVALHVTSKTWVVGKKNSLHDWREIVKLMHRDYSVSMGHAKPTFQIATEWETR